MSSVKRANSSSSRKGKKAKLSAPEPTPLGAFVKGSSAPQKQQDEAELEEAVFGRSRGGKASPWDLAEEDQLQLDEDDEEDETGLERLRDENVSPLFSLALAGARDGPVMARTDSVSPLTATKQPSAPAELTRTES